MGAGKGDGDGGLAEVKRRRAALIGEEPEKQMHNGLAIDLEVGLVSRGLGAERPAFRCGLPFRGDRRPIRDAGSGANLPVEMVTGALIEVRWLPDVSWRKRIRFSNRR